MAADAALSGDGCYNAYKPNALTGEIIAAKITQGAIHLLIIIS